MTAGYDDYYENTSPFDEDVEAFKDHLRKAVKEETQKKLEALTAANRDMTERLANLATLERAAESTKREYERKLTMAEQTARQTVQQEGLRKLLELLDEPRYRVERVYDEQPKCGKCDEHRKLRYLTPRGKEAFEMCECNARTHRWAVEELLVHEVARRNGKLLAWYHAVGSYFSDDSIGSPSIVASPEGVALEAMVKNPRDYGFTTEAAAAVLAEALNRDDT
jgi:hypothetical protein